MNSYTLLKEYGARRRRWQLARARRGQYELANLKPTATPVHWVLERGLSYFGLDVFKNYISADGNRNNYLVARFFTVTWEGYFGFICQLFRYKDGSNPRL